MCANVSDPKVNSREIRSLLKAGAALGCDRLTILTNDVEKTETQSWFGLKAKIVYIPIWKWLLDAISLT